MSLDGPAISRRLRELIHALHLELERLEWVDLDAEMRGPDEVDGGFDYGAGFVSDFIDDDLPDETDHDDPNSPLCVECGNFGRSCVC